MGLLSTKIAHASFDSVLGSIITEIINPLIIFLFALAIMFFLYGVLEFILHQDNEEAKTKGRSHMIWGVIGITIMVGVWSILSFIIKTFNIEGINVENGDIQVDLDS